MDAVLIQQRSQDVFDLFQNFVGDMIFVFRVAGGEIKNSVLLAQDESIRIGTGPAQGYMQRKTVVRMTDGANWLIMGIRLRASSPHTTSAGRRPRCS